MLTFVQYRWRINRLNYFPQFSISLKYLIMSSLPLKSIFFIFEVWKSHLYMAKWLNVCVGEKIVFSFFCFLFWFLLCWFLLCPFDLKIQLWFSSRIFFFYGFSFSYFLSFYHSYYHILDYLALSSIYFIFSLIHLCFHTFVLYCRISLLVDLLDQLYLLFFLDSNWIFILTSIYWRNLYIYTFVVSFQF